mgnify:CR=1 FL=1
MSDIQFAIDLFEEIDEDYKISNAVDKLSSRLKEGFNVNDKSELGYTPIMLFASHFVDVADIIDLLAQNGADVNEKYYGSNQWLNGSNALHIALGEEDTHINNIKKVISLGADVNSPNDSKDYPIHEAVENGHAKAIKILINNGANIVEKNEYGDTPLELAMELTQIPVALALLQKAIFKGKFISSLITVIKNFSLLGED